MEIRGQNGISRNLFIIFFTSFCILMLHNPMLAFATNYFSWGAESDTTSIGPITSYWSGTIRTTEDRHSGSASMRLAVQGDDFGDQLMGAQLADPNALPFSVVGGPAIYYRWWMKIYTGFSWGQDMARAQASLVYGSTYPRVYAGYLNADGFSIEDCSNSVFRGQIYGGGCDPLIGTSNRVAQIPFDIRSQNDNRWHEYIIMVKPNSDVNSYDAEFKAWVDGQLVGQFMNFRLHQYANNNFNEVEGTWMLNPYFQLNANPEDGGMIYLDDFSMDDAWNSIIGNPPGDTTPPVLSNPQPTGVLPPGTTQATMSLTTNENANCRYSVSANTPFDSMTNTLAITGGTTHSAPWTHLGNGQTFTRYLRCKDAAGNANTNDFLISFSVASQQPFDFSLTNSGDKSVIQGSSTTNTITATLASGGSQSVSFSAIGLPLGATASFSPTVCDLSCSSTMTINTLPTTATGTYTININGVSGAVTRTTGFSLTINPSQPLDTTPPVLSNPQPTGVLPPGTTQATMSLTTNENANCRYSVSANTPFDSMTNTLAITGGTTHSAPWTHLSNGLTFNRYVKCQDMAGNANTNDYLITFSVANPAFDFSLFNDGSNTIMQGQSTANTITSTIISGTTQSVSFSSTGLPIGATSSFSPASCSPTCTTTLTINTINSAPSGNYTINVNGIGGGLTRTTNFLLTVNPLITISCSWDFFPRDIPDGKVTLGDVLVVLGEYGKRSASAVFDSRMDFNNNSQIDLFDVLFVLVHIGACNV